MRDDIPGLASIKRIFAVSATPELQAQPRSTPPGPSSFENALQRATAARSKRYSSPLKQKIVRHAPKPAAKPPTTTHSGIPAPRLPLSTVRRPAAPARAAAVARPHVPEFDPSKAIGSLPLSAYPRPDGDNGRGMHWIPTTKQDHTSIDRFVAEAQRMGVKWVTFLNNGANVGDNDYLVNKLVGAGIEPVMRLYSPTLEPLQGDIEGMVRHYSALGVHYYQPFNEPNLNVENPDGKVSVDRYLDAWIPAARAIIQGGGLPGFGSMAPGGDFDDQQFLAAALTGLKARGEDHLLDRAWLSMHNYTWNHPIEDRGDGDGFFKFRAYNKTVRDAIGRDLPIVGTEGGTFAGEQEDPKMAAVTPEMAAAWTQQAFRYVRDQREPWLFASSVWTIADLAGGGSDPRFEAQALFHANGTQNGIVAALQNLG